MSEAPTGRRRHLQGALLLSCALALSWLGPRWEIPLGLVVLGTVLLFSCALPSFFYREVPGALPRWLFWFVAPAFGALLVWGWIAERDRAGTREVLIEIFLPAGKDPGPTVDHGATHTVVYDLREAVARERLGDLGSWGGPLPAEQAGAILAPLVCVNGEALSRLEGLGKAVEREASRRDLPAVAVIEVTADGAAVKAIVDAPEGAAFSLLAALPWTGERRATGAQRCWRAVQIGRPRRIVPIEKRTGGQRFDVEFSFPPPQEGRPEGAAERLILLLVADGHSGHIIESVRLDA